MCSTIKDYLFHQDKKPEDFLSSILSCAFKLLILSQYFEHNQSISQTKKVNSISLSLYSLYLSEYSCKIMIQCMNIVLKLPRNRFIYHFFSFTFFACLYYKLQALYPCMRIKMSLEIKIKIFDVVFMYRSFFFMLTQIQYKQTNIG